METTAGAALPPTDGSAVKQISTSLLPHLWKSVAFSGLAAITLGIAILVWPTISILVAAIFFGAYLLVTGIAQLVLAFSLSLPVGGRVLQVVSGLASVILGVLCFVNISNSVLLLAIWIGVGFVFRGVAAVVSAVDDRNLPGRGWQIFLGAVSLVAGVVMLAVPVESLATVALVVAIWLIVIGVFEIVSAWGIRRASQTLAG